MCQLLLADVLNVLSSFLFEAPEKKIGALPKIGSINQYTKTLCSNSRIRLSVRGLKFRVKARIFKLLKNNCINLRWFRKFCSKIKKKLQSGYRSRWPRWWRVRCRWRRKSHSFQTTEQSVWWTEAKWQPPTNMAECDKGKAEKRLNNFHGSTVDGDRGFDTDLLMRRCLLWLDCSILLAMVTKLWVKPSHKNVTTLGKKWYLKNNNHFNKYFKILQRTRLLENL